MKILALFQDKHKRALSRAKEAAAQNNWREVLRVTETVPPDNPSSEELGNKVIRDLIWLRYGATTEVWKITNIDNSATPSDSILNDLMFFIFRKEFTDFGAKPGWVFFLGQKHGNHTTQEIPISLISRLSSGPFKLRPISKAKQLGINGVEDVETGERGTIIEVTVFGWIDSSNVKIGVNSFTHGLFAHAYLAEVHKADEGWQIGKIVSSSVS